MQKYNLKHESLHLLTVFIITLLVYAWSAPRTVVLEDDGLFILAAYFNGIAHPPGYPLYTFLGHLMTKLSIGSIAYRVHMLSALFGALGCVGLWWAVRHLIAGRLYAYTVSLAYGFSQVYWSQAIIAEVYTLNILLFLLLFILALRYAEQADEDSVPLLAWMGFLYGLSLSNHWPLLVLSTPMLIAVMWPKWSRLIRQIPIAIPFLLLGLLPYLWMILRSQANPVISFYGPIESWADFWFVVSREGYAGMDNSPSAGWWDKWQFCVYVLKESARQLGLLASLLCMVGFVGQWCLWPRRVGVALVLGYLGNTFLLIGLLGFDYELLHRNIFRVYPLIAYMVLSIWMGMGLYLLITYMRKCWSKFVPGKVVQNSLSALVVGIVLLSNVGINYRAGDDWAESYARLILENLAADSVFFVSTDSVLAPVAYLNLINKVRSDITLYQTHGLIFSNRLYRSDKHTETERVKRIDEFIRTGQNAIYYEKNFPHNYGRNSYGIYNRVRKQDSTNTLQFITNTELINNYQVLLGRGEPSDPWQRMLYRHLLMDFCQLLAGLVDVNSNSAQQNTTGRELINQHCNTYHAHLGLIRQELLKPEYNWRALKTYFDNAKEKRDQAITKEEVANLDNYHALILMRLEKQEEAEKSLKHSHQVWPHPDNDVYKLAKKLALPLD